MRRLSTLIIFLITAAAPVVAADWPPVNPADLALKTPTIESDADAEALLWDVRVSHSVQMFSVTTDEFNYLRVKIFTDHGRDKFTTVDLAFGDNGKITDIAGRTIRPNGEIVELKSDAIYERVLAKSGDIKVKVKSFAMPAVENGAIVEYRWRKTTVDLLTYHFRLPFQREIPVHLVTYHIKLSADFPSSSRSLVLHMQAAPFIKESDGFFSTSAANIPAFREEPDMPSESQVRPWMLLYYTADTKQTPDQYWENTGKHLYEGYKDEIKINGDMRDASAEVVKGASSDEEKLRRLFEFVCKEFKNTGYESDAVREARKKVKQNNNTADTWKHKTGTGYEITLLFVALAQAQGFEARVTRTAERSFGPFRHDFTDLYFLPTYNVAVKVAGKWKFCDPASPFLPFGMLRSDEEGQVALITDPKLPVLEKTPRATPEESLTNRSATFRVLEDGSLEGDVAVSYTGHASEGRKRGYQAQSPDEREEAVRQGVRDRFKGAEVTAVKIEGVSAILEPLKIGYHVKIENYAQRTGRRLFLKCSYFNRDAPPRYIAADRKYPIVYDHAWMETDHVTYEIPPGYSLEKAEAPSPVRAGGVAEQSVRMTIAPATRILTFDRKTMFGANAVLDFPTSAYKDLKTIFDRFQEMDDHTLIIRQDSAGESK
jgi:hypothetical protein